MKKFWNKVKEIWNAFVEKLKKVPWKKIFLKTRNLSLIIGGISVILGTIIYVFLSDLFMENSSYWLIGAACLGFSGGIVTVLSEVKKESKVLAHILNRISLALVVVFVIYLHLFIKSKVYAAIDVTDEFVMLFGSNENKLVIKCLPAAKTTMIFTFIFAYLGIGMQVLNITLNATLGIEE